MTVSSRLLTAICSVSLDPVPDHTEEVAFPAQYLNPNSIPWIVRPRNVCQLVV